jgi:hypothetical protein
MIHRCNEDAIGLQIAYPLLSYILKKPKRKPLQPSGGLCRRWFFLISQHENHSR